MYRDRCIVLRLIVIDCLIITLLIYGGYLIFRSGPPQTSSNFEVKLSPPHAPYCDSRNNPEGCVCPEIEGYGWSSNGICIMRSPIGCGENGTCSDGLVCSGGRCVCRYEDVQEYSRETGVCISKVGGPCGSFGVCVENAECQFYLYQNLGACHCKTRYIENAEGHCDLTYGQNCSYPSFFHRPPSCDSAAGLVCLRGTCDCPNFAAYNSTVRTCLGFVGAPCNISETEKMQCVEGAECSRSHPTFPATCNCKEGYVRDFLGFTCGTHMSQNIFGQFFKL